MKAIRAQKFADRIFPGFAPARARNRFATFTAAIRSTSADAASSSRSRFAAADHRIEQRLHAIRTADIFILERNFANQVRARHRHRRARLFDGNSRPKPGRHFDGVVSFSASTHGRYRSALPEREKILGHHADHGVWFLIEGNRCAHHARIGAELFDPEAVAPTRRRRARPGRSSSAANVRPSSGRAPPDFEPVRGDARRAQLSRFAGPVRFGLQYWRAAYRSKIGVEFSPFLVRPHARHTGRRSAGFPKASRIRSVSTPASGLNRTELTTEKIALTAPIPSTRVSHRDDA